MPRLCIASSLLKAGEYAGIRGIASVFVSLPFIQYSYAGALHVLVLSPVLVYVDISGYPYCVGIVSLVNATSPDKRYHCRTRDYLGGVKNEQWYEFLGNIRHQAPEYSQILLSGAPGVPGPLGSSEVRQVFLRIRLNLYICRPSSGQLRIPHIKNWKTVYF